MAEGVTEAGWSIGELTAVRKGKALGHPELELRRGDALTRQIREVVNAVTASVGRPARRP